MYKVTQEGSIQGIEPIYNKAEVSEEHLRNKTSTTFNKDASSKRHPY